jgi:GR25 family glycosyltransferase involved in LPS biosynthesis
MQLYIITLMDEATSVSAKNTAAESVLAHNDSSIEVVPFRAVIPDQVDDLMEKYNLRWNYPWNGQVVKDFSSGLTKVGYNTAEPKRRIACFLSHYMLWKKIFQDNVPSIICEHDAIFHSRIPVDVLRDSPRWIASLNAPQRGATPSAELYNIKVSDKKMGNKSQVVPVPYIKETEHPAGLPGNSAYYIKPEGANKLIELTSEYGAWPNDAIMCRQLMGNKIGCLYPYVSRVQPIISTTTL